MDTLAMGVWAAMLVRHWVTGRLYLLLHPDYFWLSHTAAIALIILTGYKLFRIFALVTQRQAAEKESGDAGHMRFLPGNLSSAVLLAVAVFGLIYTPRAFASETAINRGIADTLTLTRAQPQRFARAAAPEERTVIDWIRLVNVYPEPDAYEDEPVAVQGFVMYPEGWPTGYLMVSRFVLTCCAADAYPVGLPVVLPATVEGEQPYPVDSWLSVTGKVATETLDGRRQIAIVPTEIETIEEPRNPYEY